MGFQKLWPAHNEALVTETQPGVQRSSEVQSTIYVLMSAGDSTAFLFHFLNITAFTKNVPGNECVHVPSRNYSLAHSYDCIVWNQHPLLPGAGLHPKF